MNRRTALCWLSRLLATASASLVVVPGVGYVLDSLRRKDASKVSLKRVARLSDLPPGKPVQVPIIGRRLDAWTVYPDEVIGRVWLVRAPEAAEESGKATVTAFTAVCPHLGCAIQLAPPGKNFVCPCHRAAFGFDGRPVGGGKLGHTNHAPRGMDTLECRVEQDPATDEWWVEVKYEKFEQGLTKKVTRDA
ncbi:MAG: Rieske 2Fe-2S domain-containing protein [Pirellulales bacterium]